MQPQGCLSKVGRERFGVYGFGVSCGLGQDLGTGNLGGGGGRGLGYRVPGFRAAGHVVGKVHDK